MVPKKKENDQFFAQNLQEDLENLERYIKEYSLFLPLAVFSVNPVGVIVDVNKTGREMCGYEEMELIGQDISIIFKNKKSIKSFFDKTLEKKTIKNKELTLVTKKKKEIPVRVSASTRKDEEDNVIGCFIALNDITEIKKFQNKLEKKVEQRTKDLEEAKKKAEDEKNKTSAIISNLVDPIIIIDPKNRISLFNPRAREIFEFKKSHIGKKVDPADHYSMENFKDILDKDFQVIKDKNVGSENPEEEEVIIEHEGESLTYKIVTTKVYDNENKNSIGTMKTFSDLTREKRINRMKTEFVSIAAHQLRTPLSAIKWVLKMLLEEDAGAINEDQEEALKKGFESNERMIKLVNDMLNVSRIEEGRLQYNFTKTNFKEVYDGVVNNLKNQIDEKDIKFKVKKPKKMPSVYIDKEKMKLVVQNLLENAVKYTPANGTITLKIKKLKKSLKVQVKDNGVGIPRDEQEKMFTKFFRAQNVKKMETDGSGLGLFIANNIIKKHGGKMHFKSQEAKGTEFYFYLPLEHKNKE